MLITIRCPGCDARLPLRAVDTSATIKCGGCGRVLEIHFSESIRRDRGVDRCPVCAGADFYVRKDFNPQLGVALVVAGAVVSAVFYWFGRDLVAYSILGAATLIDLLIYGFLPLVTVCYRCHSEFRGKYTRTARGFDLHTADVLEPEYERRIGRR